MASHNEDSSCDEASSSLGDSQYEFIDDQSVTDEDDQDGTTESITYSEEHELAQPTGRSHMSLYHNNHSRKDDTSSKAFFGSSATSTILGSQRSRHRSGPPLTVDEQELPNGERPSIEFEEPSTTDLNPVRVLEVCHRLYDLPGEHPSVSLADPGPYTVSVRQSMTSQSLDIIGKTYKVLFVGNSAVKEPVVKKLGAALASNFKHESRASNFNVVPISFNDEANPEVVLIDSSGLEMNVEECTQAIFLRRDGGRDTIKLALSDTTVCSVWAGGKYVVPDNWRLPDIAIIYLSDGNDDDDDVQAAQTRRFARSFMSRHGIPSIIISKDSQVLDPAEPLVLDYLSPHLFVEQQDLQRNKPKVVCRLPIGLETFLSLDAAQMNRNLNCLALARQSWILQQLDRSPNEDTAATDMQSWNDTAQKYTSRFEPNLRKAGNTMNVPFRWISLATLLVAVCFCPFYTGVQLLRTPKLLTEIGKPSSLAHSSSLSEIQTLQKVSSGHGAVSTSYKSIQIPSINSLSTSTNINFLLLDVYTSAPNKTEQFKVHILGDCHVVMRPPHWFTKLRAPPMLHFDIRRNAADLEYKASSLFDGVYALQIPREEAYGILSVSIWTQSKPIVHESFDVDFGSSWLKIAAWKRATRAITASLRCDIDVVQTGLSTVYDTTKTEISVFVNSTRQKVLTQKKSERALIVSQLRWATMTKDLLLTRGKSCYRTIRDKMQICGPCVSGKVSYYMRGAKTNLNLYVRNQCVLIAHHAQHLHRAATWAQSETFNFQARNVSSRYLHDAQKRALKTWWKLWGVPKHIAMKSGVKLGSRG